MVGQVRQNWNRVWLALALLAIASALIVLPLTSAVAVIGGALALLGLLRWHELALYALIFAVPYGSWFPIPLGVGNLTAVDVLVALVIALWFVRMSVQERGITIRFPPLSIPFAIFLFAALLSTTVALSLQHAVKEFIKWLEMFTIYIYVANNLDATKATRALAVMLLAGFSEAAIGIYQFLFRVGPEGFTLFDRFMRAYGTFEQPNPYAGYLGLIIPIAAGVMLGVFGRQQAASSKQQQAASGQVAIRNTQYAIRNTQHAIRNTQYTQWSLTALASVSLVVLLMALLMSWSRGAWLGVAAGLVVTVVVQSRRALVVSLIAAFVLVFVIWLSSVNIIPTAIAERFGGVADYFGLTISPTPETLADSSVQTGESVRLVFDVRGVKVDDANFAIVQRMAHWQAALDMFAAHPLFGVGFGNYAAVYPVYALPHWDDPLGHAHNYYLNVAAEAGLIGLLAYAVLWAAAFWQGWRAVRVSRGARSAWRSVAAGLLGVLIALSIHNGFDNLFVHGMAVQVGIGLGMVAWLGDSAIGPLLSEGEG